MRLAVKLEGIGDAALRHMKAEQEDEARRLLQAPGDSHKCLHH
jgi:hypothetical protein